MARLFEEHRLRAVQSLNGPWRFLADPEDQGKQEKWQAGLPSSCTVAVPSVWNTQQELQSYEGVAWYEKEFFTAGGCLRFCFGAVMTEAWVYFDGALLGTHYGGFTQFDFILPEVEQGAHRLSVRVDNRFSDTSIPQKKVDWYHYGGIVRDVTVETLYGISVLNYRLEYTLSEDLTRAVCTPVVELYNTKRRSAEDTLFVSLDGVTATQMEVKVRGHKRESFKLPTFSVKNIRLWDIGCPNLYMLCVRSETDDLYDRVGFRMIQMENGRPTLNHRPIEFRGVCRHEEHPDWGFAFPFGLMKKDIDLILGLGCNAIRGTYYPNSQEFMDLLDETGLLFWSEIPIWGSGFSTEALGNPAVVERGLVMHREMIKYYYNHPCIVMWGMHNDINTETDEALRMTQLYYAFLKERGGNRLVVYATHEPMTDICLKLTDMICIDRTYGWHTCYKDGKQELFLEDFIERMAALGIADKPMVMSRFGISAISGYHDIGASVWSEESQNKLVSRGIQTCFSHPKMVGGFVFQLFDTRTYPQAAINRARGFNNKGMLTEHRKPKLSYYTVQQLYRTRAKKAPETNKTPEKL